MSRTRHTSSPFIFFFFNDTATTEIYTLSLHDALPISTRRTPILAGAVFLKPLYRPIILLAKSPFSSFAHERSHRGRTDKSGQGDRKSTRLNSSHSQISYAVFCLKKKNHTLV